MSNKTISFCRLSASGAKVDGNSVRESEYFDNKSDGNIQCSSAFSYQY